MSVVSGCGADKVPLNVARVPLPRHSRVTAQRYDCPVTPSQCFRYVLLESSSTTSAARLKAAVRAALKEAGWRFRDGVTRAAVAADSPDHRLFISFETAREEILDQQAGRFDWGDSLMLERLRNAGASGRPVVAITLENAVRE
jgi:hypothetical protein